MVVILEDRLNKEKFVGKIFKNTPEEYHPAIIEAVELMEKVHKGENRLSGEEFFYHPLNVAAIVADLDLDTTSVIVALLHNTIREKSKKERTVLLKAISQQFSPEVAEMVKLIDHFSHGTRSTSDNDTITKFILASSEDLRMVIIKLADRLDNARSIDALSKEKQKAAAKNIINIYSPLCTYLNLYDMKKELEEIAFKILKPQKFEEIDQYVKEVGIEKNKIVESIHEIIAMRVRMVSKKATIYGRIKGHFSIYNKLIEKNYSSIDQIQDLIAFTVLVDDPSECFEVTKEILINSIPDMSQYEDYINHPKSTGYRAIHIVTTFEQIGRLVEIQVKTRKMHHFNAYGPASHIAYKLNKDKSVNPNEHYWVKVLHKKMFEYHSHIKEEFSEPIRSDIFKNRIYVFTPQNKLIELPVGATPIDFAYKLHSNIGNSTVGCKVNGKKHRVDGELSHGDMIELILDQNQKVPQHEWLHFVRTRKAREAIEHEYRKLVMGSDDDFMHTI